MNAKRTKAQAAAPQPAPQPADAQGVEATPTDAPHNPVEATPSGAHPPRERKHPREAMLEKPALARMAPFKLPLLILSRAVWIQQERRKAKPNLEKIAQWQKEKEAFSEEREERRTRRKGGPGGVRTDKGAGPEGS